jgi:hypothetical protein
MPTWGDALICGAHQYPQPAPTRKNTAQKNWGLVGVARGRGVTLHPATPINFQFFWAMFFLAGSGWRYWCALHMRRGHAMASTEIDDQTTKLSWLLHETFFHFKSCTASGVRGGTQNRRYSDNDDESSRGATKVVSTRMVS